jgi:DNA-binding Lrp family transcriptional regulator
MPFQLDDYDVSILKSLMKYRRKSFREISRETGITTPTVKARFQRLVNVGFIKSVSPIFDLGVVEEIVLDIGDQSKNKEYNNSQNLQQQLVEMSNPESRKG